ncbi:MAG: hypothetical protein KGK30_06450, partial [Elusimicrobia bacterium]|nr:hypothetical protein [Elusimicrobiota bacterium]
PEGVLRAARALRARRHELLVLQVLDPCERDFDYEGLSSFEDMERADGLACDPAQLRGAYAEEFERLLRFYEGGFHRCGIAYGAFFTGARWEVDLVRFLERWR